MGYRILIVDDSSVTRSVLKKTIGMTDFPVQDITQAENGQQALQLLSQEPFDLVMADLNMPQMNGIEMTQHILADNRLKTIPVVVITTEASTTRIEELKAVGIRGYVHKPFTAEGIRNMLLDVLGIPQA
jgi:two-component system, chemotaxis family, chemotaxis protein CheY